MYIKKALIENTISAKGTSHPLGIFFMHSRNVETIVELSFLS